MLVYKTNITDGADAKTIAADIRHHFSECLVNFDLEDRDNVLRVESYNREMSSKKIKRIVEKRGFQIEVLH